jgi:MIP family channel proteins
VNKYAAELLGTFALVFAGCGAIVAQQLQGSVTHVGISLVFGLVVMALAYALGDISGAHLNPAVTIGFAVAKRFTWSQVVPYVIAQCLGAIAAAALLRVLYPTATTLGQTLPSGPGWQSFVLEVVLTWLLMFVILRVSTGAKEKGIMAGAAVGATVGLDALFGGPISGASMNPARSLGPALLARDVDELWIYIAAPVVGALLAVLSEWLVCPAGQACPPAGK